MCTLGFYFRLFPAYPLVLAANRDEALTRPSTDPLQLGTSPWIYAGQDLLAGGTWLGVNEHGVVAGILNRQSQTPPDLARRSRGLLCLDALTYPSATAAVRFVAAQSVHQYNPFNLLIADAHAAYAIYADQTLRVHALTPGVYLFTNRDANDATCPRIARLAPQFQSISQRTVLTPAHLPPLFSQLHHFLADHAPRQEPRHSLCLHLDGYGTCSSTVLAYAPAEREYTYHFAPGPPCRHAYRALPVPPARLASQPPSTA